MMTATVKEAKGGFFDRAAVQAAVGKANAAALRRAASTVRVIATRSMRYRKNKSGMKGAPPGSPPFARTGKGSRSSLVRKLTFAYFDTSTKSSVVGPVKINGSTMAPNILEFGGNAPAKDRRTVRKLNDGGEIRVSSGRVGGPGRAAGGRFRSRGKTTKQATTSRGTKVWVTYAKLTSQAKVDRANEINDDLYRPTQPGMKMFPRPFMAPALKTATPRLPNEWANSVRSN
jgi:hypothetical protein